MIVNPVGSDGKYLTTGQPYFNFILSIDYEHTWKRLKRNPVWIKGC